jgi:hypothetical protein
MFLMTYTAYEGLIGEKRFGLAIYSESDLNVVVTYVIYVISK